MLELKRTLDLALTSVKKDEAWMFYFWQHLSKIVITVSNTIMAFWVST